MARYWFLLTFLLIINRSLCFPQEKLPEHVNNHEFSSPFQLQDVKESVSEYTEVKDINENIRTINEYPIIGVLAQEISYALEQVYPGMYKSFIAASYVKFVEGGGARVIPIFIDKPREYYEDIMKKING